MKFHCVRVLLAWSPIAADAELGGLHINFHEAVTYQ